MVDRCQAIFAHVEGVDGRRTLVNLDTARPLHSVQEAPRLEELKSLIV